jgi:glycosyltransferase involved in cell wall biosynthesis
MATRGRVLMVVENQSVPRDRRVWNESRTLAYAGWDVVVVCPRVAGGREVEAACETIAGVEIHRYPLRSAERALGYGREYAQALWRTARLVRTLERRGRFDVVHTANPPDFMHLALSGPRRRGARFVFDHHDLSPELYRSRFGRAGVGYRLLCALERRALSLADLVISTNESYRRIAIERGGVDPARAFVVRNGPDLERFRPVEPDPALRRGREHLIAYLGMMGPQDGIDHALHALAALRGLRADDWRGIFIGSGEMLEPMRALSAELGLADAVEFIGWRGDPEIRRILSTAAVCLAPDPPSPLNDLSTMIKVTEYMAIGRPIASYGLRETRISAGEAAAYAADSNPGSLGQCVHELLEDPQRQERMGGTGRERVVRLSWQRSAENLLDAYALLSTDTGRKARAHPDPVGPNPQPSRLLAARLGHARRERAPEEGRPSKR